MSLALLLDIAASMDADRIAVGARGDGLTTGRLAEMARTGGAYLLSAGARTLVFVGVNSAAFPVSIFAAAAAGIPICPLNYRLSAEQLTALVKRLDAPVIVADDQYAATLTGAGLAPMTTGEWLQHCRSGADGEPLAAVDPDPGSSAVLLFTSGTTSEPKCVPLEHANLQAYVLGTVEPGSASREDAALVSVPPYHIAGVGTVLTNLVAGRRLLYLPAFTPGAWIRAVLEESVSFAMLVPTMLARVVDLLNAAPTALPSLRTIAYGGARMPRPVIEQSMRLLPDVDFVNAYGLTETSSTIALLGPDDHRAALSSHDPAVRARLGSAGRLIPGVEGQIRSSSGAVLGAGAEGELWVRGEQVSGRYAGIGSVLDGEGWFPTRDRAYLDGEGYLFLRGRADDVIIRGGENVAPAEIEDRLLEFDGVTEAVALGLPDEEWGERIVAVVVAGAGVDLDPDDLREWVRATLRTSKTPDEIHVRTELPRNDTGKVVRRLLVDELSG